MSFNLDDYPIPQGVQRAIICKEGLEGRGASNVAVSVNEERRRAL